MDRIITPRELSGTVRAPVSKSSVHRLMICAALGESPTVIEYKGELSEDIIATRRCLVGLGATVTDTDAGMCVTPFDRSAAPTDEVLDCGESGSTLRFLIPVAAALGGVRRFILRGRLPERPLSPLREELTRHGATVELSGDILTVCGDGMTGNCFKIDGGVSSQFISGLLFALPLMGGGTVTVTGVIQSRPYIDMTVAALYNYGIKVTEECGVFTVSGVAANSPERVIAEGDFSGAAFFLSAGALSGEGILVTGLDMDSAQGDKRCIEILRQMGAVVEASANGILVRRGELCGTEFDAADIPDLVPVLAAVAALADGTTVITGTSRLRLKESDRIETVCAMINALGGNAVGDGDTITVTGGVVSPRRAADSAGDHRIAMAAAVLAIGAKAAVTVTDAGCVKKSYPAFWEDYKNLGGNAEATV